MREKVASPRHRDVDDRARHEQQQQQDDAAFHAVIVLRRVEQMGGRDGLDLRKAQP